MQTWFACLATGLLLTPSSVLAQGADAVAPATPQLAQAVQSGDRSDYRSLVARGIAEFNLGHWDEAKAFFSRAHALQPNARTLRTLGLVSYELRNYVDALQYLEQALASTERALAPAMRAEVSAILEEAKSFIARVVVVVEPREATLRVDEQPAVVGEDGALLLDPGGHELSAELTGFVPLTRMVRASAAERSTLRLQLQPLQRDSPIAALPPPAPDQSPPSQTPLPAPQPSAADPEDSSFLGSLSTGRQVGLVVGVAGVVGLATGALFAVLAVNENVASNRSCSERGCDRAGREHRLRAQARADGATVSFITAGVLLGTGAVLLLATGRREREPTGVLTPILMPGLAVLSYQGGF